MIEEINWKWLGDNLSSFHPPPGPEGMLPISKAWERIHILYDAYCEAKANDVDLMLLLPIHATEGTVLYFAQELVQSMVQVSMGWETGGREADARQVKILKKILSGSMISPDGLFTRLKYSRKLPQVCQTMVQEERVRIPRWYRWYSRTDQDHSRSFENTRQVGKTVKQGEHWNAAHLEHNMYRYLRSTIITMNFSSQHFDKNQGSVSPTYEASALSRQFH